jgi:hypothetical protein
MAKAWADMEKVEISVERGGRPDTARFDASVVGQVVPDEVGLFSIQKDQGHLFQQRGLMGFRGEVVVGLAFDDPVLGQFGLGVQGVGAMETFRAKRDARGESGAASY